MKEAMFYEKAENKKVKCYLCPQYCTIAPGKRGFCGVRENISGVLYSLVYGKTAALSIEPIEKKPLFHYYPGSLSLSFSTVGCNLKCLNCQNYQISQVNQKKDEKIAGKEILPKNLIEAAKTNGCQSISYTYTEPTVYFEYAYDTAVLARKEGIKNIFVTNGFITKEAMETIQPYLDAANIDLKSSREEYYRNIAKGSLKPVLEAIQYYFSHGVFIEVTTLIIPGENDSEEDLKGIAKFLSRLSKDIPWHISRFHPTYKMLDKKPTPVATIHKAIEIGKSEGLRYIYAGNVPGDNHENTFCPHCDHIAIKRYGFSSTSYLKGNLCGNCGKEIAVVV